MIRRGTTGRPSLERVRSGRLVAGVITGISRYFQIDVTLLRLAFLLLVLASGLGLLIYGVLWLALPEGGSGPWPRHERFRDQVRGRLAVVGDDIRGSVASARAGWHRLDQAPWPLPVSRWWIGVGLSAGGLLLMLASLGFFAWLTTTRALALAAIVVGSAVLCTLSPARTD